MIIKGFKNYCTVVIMAFIFGMGITIFVTDYFGDCALKIMECEAKAADINAYEWEKEWTGLQKQMADGATAVLKKEITFNDKDVSEEEKATTIKSYDINNAVPMWTLSSDMTMIADYHKNNNSLSGLIKWSDRWYIPAKTMTGEDATILLQKEKDGYHVYGQYFGNDDNYVADTADEIKDKIKKELSGVYITEVRNISIPFYDINLIYIRQEDGKEKVIPYQSESAITLNDNLANLYDDLHDTLKIFTAFDVSRKLPVSFFILPLIICTTLLCDLTTLTLLTFVTAIFLALATQHQFVLSCF